MPHHNSISEIYGQFIGLHVIVSDLTCIVNCGPFYGRVCFILNHVQTIELATGGLHVKDEQRNWMHLSSIWSVITKVCEYLFKLDISVYNFF